MDGILGAQPVEIFMRMLAKDGVGVEIELKAGRRTTEGPLPASSMPTLGCRRINVLCFSAGYSRTAAATLTGED